MVASKTRTRVAIGAVICCYVLQIVGIMFILKFPEEWAGARLTVELLAISAWTAIVIFAIHQIVGWARRK